MSNMFLDALAAPPPRRGTAPAGSYPYRRDPQTGLSTAQPDSKPTPEAAKDPAAMLSSALELVKAAGYRVTKPKAKVKDRVGPTFVATFADSAVTRMSTFTSLAKLDVDRGLRLARAAYESRSRCFPNGTNAIVPPIVSAHFEQDGVTLASYDFADRAQLAA
jgi:hypothetical protein